MSDERAYGPNAAISLPSQEYLNERLHYDPEMGCLTWRAHIAMPRSWNTRYAGTAALSAQSRSGHLRGRIDGRAYSAHRVIWKMVHGDDPAVIDHINSDPKDNRLDNLRSVTQQENCAARRKTVQFSGITWRADKRRWVAKIYRNGKRFGLGHHVCWAKALRARLAAERELAA